MNKQMNLAGWNKSLFLSVLLLMGTVAEADPLKDFNGKPQAIKNFTGQGKWLVVMIWASDCHVCNVEAKHYIHFHDRYKNKNARILGISIDGQAKKAEAEKFIQRHHTTFPNLIGEPLEVAQWFVDLTGADWVGTPTFLIYNPKGELVVQQVGAVPVKLIEDFIQKESKSNPTPENHTDI